MEIKIFNDNLSKNLEQVYKNVAKWLEENRYIASKQIFLQDLRERESLGSIVVAENFYLPHVQNDNVSKSVVVRIDGFRNNIIFILLSQQDEQNKEKIKKFIMKLVDDNLRKEILKCDEEQFIKIVLA